MNYKNLFIFFLLVSFANLSFGQLTGVIDTKKKYLQEIKLREINRLVNLKQNIQNIVFDLKYATTQNFTNTNLYKKASTTYLRKEAATALALVANELALKKYQLKIFDAYRPYSATQLMWDLIKDERYVANPAKGSNHNRGLAIDLTIVDEKGNELDMGTGFDNFTDTAHHSFTTLTNEILDNRKLLKSIMEKYGFKALETEWWHYSFITKESYSVIDIPFKKLKKWIQ